MVPTTLVVLVRWCIFVGGLRPTCAVWSVHTTNSPQDPCGTLFQRRLTAFRCRTQRDSLEPFSMPTFVFASLAHHLPTPIVRLLG